MDEWLCGTPFERQAAEKEWKQLVREAIRDKGGKVHSIAQAIFEGSLSNIWRSIRSVTSKCCN